MVDTAEAHHAQRARVIAGALVVGRGAGLEQIARPGCWVRVERSAMSYLPPGYCVVNWDLEEAGRLR
jgi:hypothetical protein